VRAAGLRKFLKFSIQNGTFSAIFGNENRLKWLKMHYSAQKVSQIIRCVSENGGYCTPTPKNGGYGTHTPTIMSMSINSTPMKVFCFVNFTNDMAPMET